MAESYDIIVIGGGHAGCEAAAACGRKGLRTLMLTLRRSRIAHTPCNPAVGGLAKGHLVKEIDALGGQMAYITDIAGIQFRMLNRGKGPAVWSPRAQVDKDLYHRTMLAALSELSQLTIAEAEAKTLIIDHNTFKGVELAEGTVIYASKCIITAGTFMRGLLHVGDKKTRGGREGDPASAGLSESMEAQGFRLGRMKTGTPPRVFAKSLNFDKMQPQPGDADPSPFSWRTGIIEQAQVDCHLTSTNERSHDIIRDNLHRSPLYSGEIKGVGPRYCPSIEDKVVRFAARTGHQIFIEPEGRDHPEVYVNGMSTSMPVDVQVDVLHTVLGMEDAVLARPGYAVEYDYFPPDQVGRTLESNEVRGLYFAGQVNGTSGYEEAAAQGFIAGINAALSIGGGKPLILGRDEAYIGVLIDDLTTKEIDEPYRMFTSRAEFRLLLRQDNALDRLMHYGAALGLIPDEALEEVEKKSNDTNALVEALEKITFPLVIGNELFTSMGLNAVEKRSTMAQVLKRPQVHMEHIVKLLQDTPRVDRGVAASVEYAIKYAGYIEKQERQINQMRGLERSALPLDFPYADIPGLSAEARSKLSAKKPETMGQASRIAGVRAADLSILAVHIERLSASRHSAGKQNVQKNIG